MSARCVAVTTIFLDGPLRRIFGEVFWPRARFWHGLSPE